MNKQELIEQIEGLKKLFGNKSEYVEIDTVIRLISELDKQQEVESPMFVADFITEQKKLGYTLPYSIDACMSDRVAEWYWDNSELFALSWVNGYTVEKEKRYLVKMKGMDKEFTMLKLDKIRGSWYLGNDNEYSYTKTAHTHKELEEAWFGEVLNSPLFEVDEVEV